MKNTELILAINLLEKEKGVDAEVLFETIENAIVLGIKKKQGSEFKNEELEGRNYENLEAQLDRETGEISVYLLKDIVEEVEDPINQISLSDAIRIDTGSEIGGVIREKMAIDTKDMGRTVAQTAKQIITQKIREVERNNLFDEFVRKEREVVTGVVTRITPVGKTEIRDKKGDIITYRRQEAEHTVTSDSTDKLRHSGRNLTHRVACCAYIELEYRLPRRY